MSTVFEDAAVSLPFWIMIKASALLGVAALVQVVFWRRASAASRHVPGRALVADGVSRGGYAARAGPCRDRHA